MAKEEVEVAELATDGLHRTFRGIGVAPAREYCCFWERRSSVSLGETGLEDRLGEIVSKRSSDLRRSIILI
jgi:hypothetical protein